MKQKFEIYVESEGEEITIELECKLYHHPYEAPERGPDALYPGCDESYTVEDLEITGLPDTESVIRHIDLLGGTYQDEVEEYKSGITIVFSRTKGLYIEDYDSDEILEYLEVMGW